MRSGLPRATAAPGPRAHYLLIGLYVPEYSGKGHAGQMAVGGQTERGTAA